MCRISIAISYNSTGIVMVASIDDSDPCDVCPEGTICEKKVNPCQIPPCPVSVTCSADPCATVRCANGYQCEVFKFTGEAYCQPNCSLNNGGCPADQECRLQPVVCVRAPCPPVIDCVERITACPPTCSKEFCSKKGNQRAMCSKWVLYTRVVEFKS